MLLLLVSPHNDRFCAVSGSSRQTCLHRFHTLQQLQLLLQLGPQLLPVPWFWQLAVLCFWQLDVVSS
jgi:hypothetical protein